MPDLLQPPEYHQDCQHAADSLAEKSRPGHSGHSHMEGSHEPDIHSDVGERGDRQKEEGRPGISQSRKDPRGYIIKEHERKPPDINIQIELGIRQDLRRRMDGLQQDAASQDPCRHQHGAEHGAGDHGRMYGRLHPAIILGSEKLGDDDGTADVAAKGEGDEDQSDLITVPHGGQRIFSHELSGHQTVRNVIELLEDNAPKQRKAEFP